jgi:hypothetical protein
MNMLKKALLQECQMQMLSLFLLLIGSAALIIFTFEKSVILPCLGLIGSIISIQLIYRTARLLNVEDHRLIWFLQNQPHAIVWVYSVKTDRLPFGFQLFSSTTLYFKLSNGDEITVSLRPQKLKVISKFLNRLLPHASFGYSHDRAQWYHVHPDMLRKETEK